MLRGIVVEVDLENIESYLQKERKKERGMKGKVVRKLSKREKADKIKLNEKKLKNIHHIKMDRHLVQRYL